MTRKQRITLWQMMSRCLDGSKKKVEVGPCQAHAYQQDWDEERMDRIGQNGNDGEHYMKLDELIKQEQSAEPGLFRHEEDDAWTNAEDGRWNWYGDGESDATSMDDDLPSAAEDCARTRGSYEI